jgi:hypothetical protein
MPQAQTFSVHGEKIARDKADFARDFGLIRSQTSDILRFIGESMAQYRLGDVIDDHCIKCRRVTNHSIVSLVDDQAAKVRCRTCYHDHDYRHEQAPPSKKELKKMAAQAAETGGANQEGSPAVETPTGGDAA